MKNYIDLLKRILADGQWMDNRTGVRSLRVEGAMLEFDLREGFPAVTTKRLAFRSVVGELLGFLRGYTDAAAFRELGCKVWDANANLNQAWLNNPFRAGVDDLGLVYGAQWRGFGDGTTGRRIDQLRNALELVHKDPDSRRIIVNAWNPLELEMMALPPCHLMFQLLPNRSTGGMSLVMYQRSCDMFLGVPFNIASYALLLELICRATGYRAERLVMFLADAHIYENHLDQVHTQIGRQPLPLPALVIDSNCHARDPGAQLRWLEQVAPEDIWLELYNCHPAIAAEMAI